MTPAGNGFGTKGGRIVLAKTRSTFPGWRTLRPASQQLPDAYWDLTCWRWGWIKRGEEGWLWNLGPLLLISKNYSERYTN